MKCKMCGGAGVIQGQAPGLVSCCPACNGKGFIEQTNEEWLRTSTTEQLAEFISKIDMPFMDKAPFPCGDLIECNKNCGLYSRCVKDDFPTNKEVWVEWLKEIHDEM